MSVLNVDHDFVLDGQSKSWNIPVSAEYMFYATGTFNGGTLSLEASPDNGANWFTVDKLTAPGRLIRYLVTGEKVRLCLSNSVTPNITAGLRQ